MILDPTSFICMPLEGYTCPSGYFLNKETITCDKCALGCISCVDPSGCSVCDPTTFLFNNTCTKCETPYLYTVNNKGVIIQTSDIQIDLGIGCLGY